MKRVLKIVGRISDKSAKANISLVLCSVFLLLVASIYVFGEGITGAAVTSDNSGAVVNLDGSSYWEKAGVGRVEWDKHVTPSCRGTRYLNLTSHLSSQNLDVCIRTERGLVTSQSDAWLWSNFSHTVDVPVYVNNSYYDAENQTNVENGSWVDDEVQEYFFDWYNIKDKFSHVSYDGDEYYCLQNVYVVKDRKYEFMIDFGFTIQKLSNGWDCDEKFGLFIKRSVDTIADVLSNGNYVELDPFAGANYNHCRNIPVNISNVNEPVYVDVGVLEYDHEKFKSMALYNGANCDGGSQAYFMNMTFNNSWVSFVNDGTTTGYSLYYDNTSAVTGSYYDGLFALAYAFVETWGGGSNNSEVSEWEPIVGSNSIIFTPNSVHFNEKVLGSISSNTANKAVQLGFTSVTGNVSAVFWYNGSRDYADRVDMGFGDYPYSNTHMDGGGFGIRYDFDNDIKSIGTWTDTGADACSGCFDAYKIDYDVVADTYDLYFYQSLVLGSEAAYANVNDVGTFYWETGNPGSFPNASVIGPIFVSNYSNLTFYNGSSSPAPLGVDQSPNIAPTIQGDQVTISPSPEANDDFDLSCTFTPVDPDNETLTAEVDWYNNTGTGGVIAVQNSMIVNNDTSSKSFVLDDANTTIGEYWNCSVRVCDHEYCSDWVNSSETTITSGAANWTDFTTQLQSLNVKDVYVYDTSKENWNRTDQTTNWYYAKYGYAIGEKFPDKVYLFLTNKSLDIFDASSTDTAWMVFSNGSGYAIESTNDFTSVYALDGKIYIGSDKGMYILDFANDNISRYDSSGLAYFNSETPFEQRNDVNTDYKTPEGTGLTSNGVNDVYANKVKGKHLVGVATDGSSVGGVNVIDVGDGSVATLRFFGTQANFDSDSIVIADDGTLYYSENNVANPSADNNRVSYKYSIESYNGSSSNGDGYYASKGSTGAPSSNVTYPHFPTLARITNIYVTSYTSRMHDNHNTIYVATEKGVSVIQEVQGNEGVGGCKLYGFTGSTNSELDYKVLAGSTDNITAVTARSDGNAMYAGTNSGIGAGSVSEVSLNSNTLTGSWNKETDPSIVGNDTTSIDFLDGDLLVGTLDSGATQIVKHELDHYLITDYTNHRVVEIDNTGLIHWAFGVYGTAGNDTTHLTYPTNAVRHDDGNYLIADSGNRRILEVDPDGAVVQQISNLTQLSDATVIGEVYSVQKITQA